MRLIRNAIGATTIDRELLTSAERLQHDGYLRREEANAAIMAMAKDGVSIKQIVRQTGHSRKTVRQVIRGARADVFRSRMNSLEPYLLLLDSHWTAGCSNGAECFGAVSKPMGSAAVPVSSANGRHVGDAPNA